MGRTFRANVGRTGWEAIPNQDLTVGVAFTLDLASYGPGRAISYNTHTGYSLPAGLTLDAETGVVSGVPTIIQAFSVVFDCDSGYGFLTSPAVPFDVTPNIINITLGVLPAAMQPAPQTVALNPGVRIVMPVTAAAMTPLGQTINYIIAPPPPQTATYIIEAGTSNSFVVRRVSDSTVVHTGTTCTGFNTSTGVAWALAGQTFEFQNGTHGERIFQNMVGTPAARIKFRGPSTPSGGQAIIRRLTARTGSFVMNFATIRYVDIDGTNTPSAPNGCGIKVMHSSSGIDAPSGFLQVNDSAYGKTHNPPWPSCFFTIRGVWVEGGYIGPDGNPATLSTNGIGLQINDHTSFKYADYSNTLPSTPTLPYGQPTLWREGIVLEYNRITNVKAEGIYCGPNWRSDLPGQAVPSPDGGDIPYRDCEIAYNYLNYTGADAVNPKSWVGFTTKRNSVHHNTVLNGGRSTTATKEGGISALQCNVDIYNNIVMNCGDPGIQMYCNDVPVVLTDAFGPILANAWNNIVYDQVEVVTGQGAKGISSGTTTNMVKTKSLVYNNTVVNCVSSGINISSNNAAGNVVAHNVVAGTTGIVSYANCTLIENSVTTTAAANFQDLAAKDFRLTAASPAVDIAFNTNYIAANDYLNVTRPQGARSDAGAYEYVAPVTRNLFYEAMFKDGRIYPAPALVDGGYLTTLWQPQPAGQENATPYVVTSTNGAGPTSGVDVIVVPGGTFDGVTVTPRSSASGYYQRHAIYHDKHYERINNSTYPDLTNTNDKPRTEISLIHKGYNMRYDKETWVGFSVYTPPNYQYDRGSLTGHAGGYMVWVANSDTDHTTAQLNLFMFNNGAGNYYKWYYGWTLRTADIGENANGVNGTLGTNNTVSWVDLSALQGAETGFGDLRDDVGKWTDFVIRMRINPFSVTTNPSVAYAGAYPNGPGNGMMPINASYTGNTGIIEVWKSVGAAGPNGERQLVKRLSRVSQPYGLVPVYWDSAANPTFVDQKEIQSGFRIYKYGWYQRFSVPTTTSLHAGTVIWHGFSDIRFGETVRDGTTLVDVMPTGAYL